MLKSRINNKADFDALSDALKALYKEENGVWLLQSDGADELRRAKDEEAERRRKAEEERDELRRKEEAAARETARLKDEADRAEARKKGDLKALEETLNAQHKAAMDAATAETERLKNMLRMSLVDGLALNIATEISTVPDLLAPEIAKRLEADISGPTGVVRIKDAVGNVSATLTPELLKKEFVDNTKYAAIIKGTNASGAGGNGSGSGGGAVTKKISEMTEAERVVFYRRDPDAYRTQARAEGLPVSG